MLPYLKNEIDTKSFKNHLLSMDEQDLIYCIYPLCILAIRSTSTFHFGILPYVFSCINYCCWPIAAVVMEAKCIYVGLHGCLHMSAYTVCLYLPLTMHKSFPTPPSPSPPLAPHTPCARHPRPTPRTARRPACARLPSCPIHNDYVNCSLISSFSFTKLGLDSSPLAGL